MLIETLDTARDLGRLKEILGVMVRHGFGDTVRRLGLADKLERAGQALHWSHAADLARLEPPVQVRLALEELGPAFVKFGQILAGRADLFRWLSRLTDDNPKKEYFLTGIVAEANADEMLVRASIAPETAVMGTDTPAQLAQAEAIWQQRRRAHFLNEGVGLVAPETVHFSWDTQIGPGTIVEQFSMP